MSYLHKVREPERLIMKKALVATFCIFLAFATGCKTMEDVYSPEELRDLFANAGGWTPLPFPDSKYRPGAIIKVTEDGIRWIDDLTSCRYPLSEFELKSYIPDITFTKSWEFGAGAVINIQGITAGPSFNRISKVRMEITDHGADAFRLIKLKVWMEDPDNREKVSQACMDELLQPDTYLITEAFRVSKGKYTLFDKSGAAVKIETPAIGNLLQFQPDVNFEVTSDGSLVIEQSAYFAIRKAVRVGDGFQTLKSPGEESITADTKIKNIFFKRAGKK